MNYGLLFPLWQTFGKVKSMPKLSALEFVERVNQLITTYPKPVLEAMYNLVDSHDTARLLTLTEGNLNTFKQAYLFMFAFPGSPSLFYGDEIGVDGDHDPKNRRPMPWSAMNLNLLAWFKQLIHLRKTLPALRSSEGHLHHEGDLIIYAKDNELLLVLNTGPDQWIDLTKYGFKGAHVLFESQAYHAVEKDGYKLYQK
jgi:glycosidase